MATFLRLLMALAALGGCSQGYRKPAPANANILASTAPEGPDGTMRCDPHKVGPDDVLKIRLPAPHAENLAVVDPSGKYYFIAYTEQNSDPATQPVISGKSFKLQTLLLIQVSHMRGTTGREAPRQIFKSDGRYRIIVGPELETEDPLLDGWCFVEFHNATGPRK